MFLAASIDYDAVAQDRTAGTKYSFSFYSSPVSNFKKWTKRSTTGEWSSEQPDKYKGPKEDEYKGALNWDIVSFKADGKDVYAIRYKVGSYSYEYPSLEVGTFWSTSYIYYFITYHDVLKLQSLPFNEVVRITPYGRYNYDFGEDRLVRSFMNHEYKDISGVIMLVKYTTQNNNKVVRFTLPYEGYKTDSVFEKGPYYELSYGGFSKFAKSLQRIPCEIEYLPRRERSSLLKEHSFLTVDDKKSNLKTYDTTSWYLDVFKLVDNQHYYDGQRIMLLPADPYPQDAHTYKFLDSFVLQEEVSFPQLADTLWLLDKKGRRIGSHVQVPKSDAYKAAFANNEDVRRFTSTRGVTNNIERATGYYTPLEAVEGKIFTIVSATTKKRYSVYEVLLELIDDDGGQLFFTGECYSYDDGYSYKDKDGFLPFMLLSMYDKTKDFYSAEPLLPKSHGNYYTFVAEPIGKNKYEIIDDQLVYSDIRLKHSSQHHDFISSSERGREQSYSMYYQEPYLYLRDISGNEYEMPLAEKQSRSSSTILQGQVNGGGSSVSYKKLLLEDLEPASVYYAEQAKKREEERARLAADKQKYQERLSELTKKYGRSAAKDIMDGYVRTGWGKEKCIESWGKPKSINKSTGAWGVHEQWVYGDGNYLYFENGILTSIQN